MPYTASKSTIYCIPGLGTNKTLFKNLELDQHRITHVTWEKPFKNESLPDYAMRLAKQIDTSKPFILLGVSFGGMCAIEIAKQFSPLKTFLVSSSKTKEELPGSLKILSVLPVHKLLTEPVALKGAGLFKKRLGVTRISENDFQSLLTPPPEGYFSNTIHMIVNWKNETYPQNVVHIHGNADRVLPYKEGVKYDYIIEGGTHFMVMDRAGEISGIINNELNNILQ